jgi:hypothetical protein
VALALVAVPAVQGVFVSSQAHAGKKKKPDKR